MLAIIRVSRHGSEWFKFELYYLYLPVDLFMDKLATKNISHYNRQSCYI